MRKWKQLADKLTQAAKTAEEEGRCRKTKTVMAYLGSFVEMPEQRRCVLDPDYPIELVEQELREAGIGPEGVAERGKKFAEGLLRKRQKGTDP